MLIRKDFESNTKNQSNIVKISDQVTLNLSNESGKHYGHLEFAQSQENITVARPLTGGRSSEDNKAPMAHPNHAHFLLFCE